MLMTTPRFRGFCNVLYIERERSRGARGEQQVDRVGEAVLWQQWTKGNLKLGMHHSPAKEARICLASLPHSELTIEDIQGASNPV
eukprot:6530192-Lingulodinium_polyedra.AAC.1